MNGRPTRGNLMSDEPNRDQTDKANEQVSRTAANDESAAGSSPLSAARGLSRPKATTSGERTRARASAPQGTVTRGDVVEINQGGAEQVEARKLTVSQGGIGQAQADAITVRQGGIGRARGGTIDVSQGGVGLARGERISVQFGGLGAGLARDVRLSQGVAGTIVANEVHLEQAGVRTLVARTVHADRGTGVVFLFAQRVEGSVRTLFDWRAGLAFGAAFGLIAGLVRRRR